MRTYLILSVAACGALLTSGALAGPIHPGNGGGLPTLQRLVQNLSQAQVQGQLGSPSRRGGEVSLRLQPPAASAPGGGMSMVYVAGDSGFVPSTGLLTLAGQRSAGLLRPQGQNTGFASSSDYSLGQTLGVSVSELGNYLYVVHVPFNIAITDRYTDPGPADTGQMPVVVVPAPSSTMLGLLGLMLMGTGILRMGRMHRFCGTGRCVARCNQKSRPGVQGPGGSFMPSRWPARPHSDSALPTAGGTVRG